MKNKDELIAEAEQAQKTLLSSMTDEQKQLFENADKMMSEMMGVSDMSEFMNLSAKEQKKRACEMNEKMFAAIGMTKEDAIRADREMREQSRKESSVKATNDEVDLLRPLLKNVIYIKAEPEAQTGKTASKIGGNPDLPNGFEWYVNSQGEPLSFLMQINLSDVHKYDKENVLPESGMLYFFYDTENQPWSSDDDTSGYSVFFYDGDPLALVPTYCPVQNEDNDTTCIIDETPVSFFCMNDLPSYEDYCNICNADNMSYEHYEAAKEELIGYSSEEYADDYFKLLGYANIIQNGLTDEFGDDYTLLCQFTTYESVENGFMFGDGGNLYYMIKKSDLEKSCFAQTEISLQCY